MRLSIRHSIDPRLTSKTPGTPWLPTLMLMWALAGGCSTPSSPLAPDASAIPTTAPVHGARANAVGPDTIAVAPGEVRVTVAPGRPIRRAFVVPAGEAFRVRALKEGVEIKLGVRVGKADMKWYSRGPGLDGLEEFAGLNDGSEPLELHVHLKAYWPKEPAGEVTLLVDVGSPDATERSRAQGFAALNRADAAKAPIDRQQELAEAMARFQRIRDRRWEAYALDQLGRVDKHLKRRADGLAKRERALKIRRAIGDRGGQVVSLIGIGNIQYYLGEHTAARENWSAARYLAREIGDVEAEAIAIGNLGTVEADRGRYDEAMQLARRSLKLHRRLGDARGEARSLAELGWLLAEAGDRSSAVKRFEEALTINRREGFDSRQAEVLGALAEMALEAAGDPLGRATARRDALDKALQLGNEALKKRRSLSFASDREPFALDLLGRIHRLRGAPADAVSLHRQALEGHRRSGSKVGEANSRWALGLAMASTGSGELGRRKALDNATVQLRQSASLFRSLSMVREEARSQTSLAQVALARAEYGDPVALVDAAAAANQAVRLVETARAYLGDERLRRTYLGRARDAYDIKMFVELARFERSGDLAHRAAAFEAMERGRARALLDRLTAGAETETGEASTRLGRQLTEKYREVQADVRASERHLRRTIARNSPAEEAKARTALVHALERLEKVRRDRLELNPTWRKLSSQGVSLAQVQGALPRNHHLVLWSVGRSHVIAWVVSRRAVKVVELPAAARWKVIDLVTRARKEVLVPQGISSGTAVFAALSDALVTPLKLRAGNVTVAADGPLYDVPWVALPGLAGRNVALVPSGSVLATVANRRASSPVGARSRFAIFDDPVFDTRDERYQSGSASGTRLVDGAQRWRRLRFSSREAEVLEEMAGPTAKVTRYSGFRATRAVAMSDALADVDLIHFATHATVDRQRPGLSGLVLSLVDQGGRPQPGMLRLYDLYAIDIDAQVVTLSACDSAAGPVVQGEGVVGLTRGFLSAGARAVVASDWKVHDRAAGFFMAAFYKALLKGRRPPAEALAAAQASMRASSRWSAPFYWAGFNVHGIGWH